MSTQLNPLVLEARFGEMAVALSSSASVSSAAINAMAAQARLALRGFDAALQHDEAERLSRAASRLARRLAVPRGAQSGVVAAIALERIVLQLGIETGRRLEPRAVGAAVRSVLIGWAELQRPVDSDVSRAEPADLLDALFIKMALVVATARSNVS